MTSGQKPGKAQQLTSEEKELTSKLRSQLPDIIHEAEKASKEPVSSSLWGVPLLPALGSSSSDEEDLRVDVILLKFLKARSNDIEQARDMLTETLKWRAEYKVDGILDEEFPQDVFAKVGFLYGHDREGRPVTYNYYGNLDNKEVFGDLDRFLRWRVQLHERGMSQLDFVDVADMVQVHDYDGVGLFSYDKFARAASKATIQVMSGNYPETLATKIFANVPGWGETVFSIICRWLSEETKRKFVVVSKASAPKALAERIGEQNIPEAYRSGSGKSEKPAAVAPPPEPETAHADPLDGAPVPTATDDDEGGTQGSSAQDRVPPPPTVTAAPAPANEAADDPASETAGMRLDDKTDAGEEAPKTRA